jgi:hypothetical protein
LKTAQVGEPKKDVNLRTAQLVQLLTEVGPDIPEISRKLGQFKESVRYRYKEKILNRGLAVQAAIDHEKLGLRRLVFVVEFAEPFEAYAESILTAMNELCYVVNFVKTLPSGSYVVNASVPNQFAEEYQAFIKELEAKGLFTRVQAYSFEWVRNPPMRAEFYDFDTGRWDFDWSAADKGTTAGAVHAPSSRSKFDMLDLLILKELQIDGNKSMIDIANTLKVNYKKLAWHYSTHVVKRGLTRGYRVNWMGSRYDYKLERALHRQHRYVTVELLVRDTSQIEQIRLREMLNRLPFLWAEAGGRDYYAQLAFPVDVVNEGFQYLGKAVGDLRHKAQYFVIDVTNALGFTISYKLFDTTKKNWTFNRGDLINRFGNMMLKIKEGAG